MSEDPFAAPPARAHGLGPSAIEIEDLAFVSVFVAVGECVYLEQPRPVDGPGGDSLIVLGREAALRLADVIVEALR